jgi:hypothetical protein
LKKLAIWYARFRLHNTLLHCIMMYKVASNDPRRSDECKGWVQDESAEVPPIPL